MFLTIHTINASFVSKDSGKDYATREDAHAAAVDVSLEIAAEEIRAGKNASSVEAVVKNSEGECVDRMVTAISVSPLLRPEQGESGA
jgi:hypothetical protein